MRSRDCKRIINREVSLEQDEMDLMCDLTDFLDDFVEACYGDEDEAEDIRCNFIDEYDVNISDVVFDKLEEIKSYIDSILVLRR